VLVAATVACSRAAPQAETVEPIAVTVQAARLGSVRDAISFPGTVTPQSLGDFIVIAPVPCTVSDVTKAEGDRVTAGEIIVKLDIAAISGEIATRQLELTDAIARVDRTKAETDRMSGLYDKGLASRLQWESARAAQSSAEAARSQAQAHMDSAKALESSTIIRARFNGVVAKRWHTGGELVQGGDADPIIRIIDPARLQVSAQVPLTDGGRILVGQAAIVQAPNGPEAATVALKVSPASPAIQTYEVRFNFAAPTSMPLDSPVQVDILIDERKEVLVIPSAAVQGGGGTTFVWVATPEGVATKRDVRVGLSSNNATEIIAGLVVGDQVIVTGIAELSEGQAITISK
jgi:membrane fusion protein (multidrug efflux system)